MARQKQLSAQSITALLGTGVRRQTVKEQKATVEFLRQMYPNSRHQSPKAKRG